MANYRFMISGGGTGGHIFPAIAIADELKTRYPEAEFLFVGAKNRMEMKRVPQAGYQIEGLWISGIQRKLSASNLLFPFKLLSSLVRCRQLIRKFKPDVVIGTGGFASGPLLYTASAKNIPCLIQEQNSYPGITNKILGPRVQKVCVAYENMDHFFPPEKVVLTGNPIRPGIQKIATNPKEAVRQFSLNPDQPTLLVLGGSLGAQRINEVISENIAALSQMSLNLIWQCGKLYYEDLQKQYPDLAENNIYLTAFLNNMETAYAAADVIISRAGAGTLSELAVAGKASILIPSPNVAEDHQTKNAQTLVEREAAMLFRESENSETLLKQIHQLVENEKVRHAMEENICKMALPQASAAIADEIEKILPHA